MFSYHCRPTHGKVYVILLQIMLRMFGLPKSTMFFLVKEDAKILEKLGKERFIFP